MRNVRFPTYGQENNKKNNKRQTYKLKKSEILFSGPGLNLLKG